MTPPHLWAPQGGVVTTPPLPAASEDGSVLVAPLLARFPGADPVGVGARGSAQL